MQKQNRKKSKISYCFLCGGAVILALLMLLPGCSGFLDGTAFDAHILRYTGKIAAQEIVVLEAVTQNTQGFFMVPRDIASTTGITIQVSLNNYSGAELIPELENDYGGTIDVPQMNADYSIMTINIPSDSTVRDFDLKVNFTSVELRRKPKPVVLPKIVYKRAGPDFYVDSVGGVDTGNYVGTLASPFKTLECALDYAAGELGELYLKANTPYWDNTLAYRGNIVVDGKIRTELKIQSYSGAGDVAKIVPSNAAQNIIEVKNGGRLAMGLSGDKYDTAGIVLTGATRAAALFVHSETATSSVATLYGSIEDNVVSGTPASAVHVGNKGEVDCRAAIRNNQSTGSTQSSAIYVNGATAKFKNTTSSTNKDEGIYQNTSSTNGGAFYMTSGTIELSQGYTFRNQAKKGGLAYLTGGEITIGDASSTGFLIDQNLTNGRGNGGAFYINGGTVTAVKCHAKGNSARGSGGVVYIERGTFQIEAGADVEIKENAAYDAGGGVFVGEEGMFIARSGVIQNNLTVTSTRSGKDVYVAGGRTMKVSGTVNIAEVRLNVGANRAIIVLDGSILAGMGIGIDTLDQPTGLDVDHFLVELPGPGATVFTSTIAGHSLANGMTNGKWGSYRYS